MNARQTHRGPDDVGVYVDPVAGVALGATRLSIIDVKGGHQPLSNEDGTVWATLNGEIYNHPRLQRWLRGRGHELRSGTDTEVLVHLYEDLGDDLVHALEGMYAFAIWDTRRRRLLLGRDRFGEKPLLYVERGGVLSFASELTALRAGVGELDEIRPEAVDAFFVLGYVPGASIIDGVKQLPPGHLLTWNEEEPVAHVRRYWALPARAPRVDASFEEIVQEAHALLEDSIASRLISDVPLGVFLSGGTDSSLVTALATQKSSRRVQTFTVTYDVGDVSEAVPARDVARRLGTEHHEFVLREDEVATRVIRIMRSLDQPLADFSLIALNAVAEMARGQVTVALGGEGADELFAGYPRYHWMQRAEMAEHVPERWRRSVADLAMSAGRGRTRRLGDVLRPADPVLRHVDWVSNRRRDARDVLYGPALRPSLDEDWALADARAVWHSDGARTVVDNAMRLDVTRWLCDDVLAKADRASMLTSLEMRTPYLHRELAEFAAVLPLQMHLGMGGKAILRSVLRRVAPELPRRRQKKAFRVPVSDWLRGPLQAPLNRILTAGPLVEEQWFDVVQLRRIADDHATGQSDETDVLWPVLSFGLWLEGFRGHAVA